MAGPEYRSNRFLAKKAGISTRSKKAQALLSLARLKKQKRFSPQEPFSQPGP
jgi:hypothetical protein